MNKHLLVFMFLCSALALVACTHNTNSRTALGTHNLSKGSCSAPQFCLESSHDCETKVEEMTQAECQALNGEFTPRQDKPEKRFWLF